MENYISMYHEFLKQLYFILIYMYIFKLFYSPKKDFLFKKLNYNVVEQTDDDILPKLH